MSIGGCMEDGGRIVAQPDLGRRDVVLLAIASAVITANAYYIHPIIRPIAESFAISDALVGVVPAMNQIALALGVVLLLPLGDRVNNRLLASICLAAQTLALLVMAVSTDFTAFTIASGVLGFFTVTPYLLPAYASKRVAPSQLGFVTAMLTTGVVAGVIGSRALSGALAEAYGWRSVYWAAAGMMLLATIAIPMLMKADPPDESGEPLRYDRLLASLAKLAAERPRIVASGLIQGISFCIFIFVSMGIGLHLTSAEIGLGTDTVGYLALFSLLNLMTTPGLGKWADRVGAEHARLTMTLVQLAGVSLLSLVNAHWLLLAIPIVLNSIAAPMIDVSGRMTSLREPPERRSRLLTIYIALMFLGGSFGSWAGAAVYDYGGWTGTVIAATALALMATALAARERSLIR